MRNAILMFCLALGLGACGKDAETVAAEQKKGREETKNIRATEHIGYSGDAVADKVDNTLNAADQRQQKLDSAAEPAQ